MLVELKYVETEIDPREILTKALQEGDLDVKAVLNECEYEEGIESILDAVDNDEILRYVQKYDLDVEINNYDFVIRSIKEFTHTQKALLLWQLIQCEEV